MVYEKYVKETFDSAGNLIDMQYQPGENFNFAYDIVDRLAMDKPDDTALVWCNVQGDERIFTYRQMMELSNRVANYFTSLGICKGDKVLLVLKRHHEWWYAMLALHKIGAVCIPATNLLTPKDLIYRFQAADIKMVVCTNEGDVASYIDQVQDKCPTLTTKVMVREDRTGWESFDKGLANASGCWQRPTGQNDPKTEDIMLLYFTSGTTGMPKMVAHDFSYPLGHIITGRYWQQVQPGGLHLTVADTGWGKAVWGKFYGQWTCETAIFVYDFDKFVPADLLGIVSKYKITTFCAPPTIFRFFIQEDIAKYDLSSLTHVSIAGEALNPEIFEKFKEATGLEMMEGFGQTETTATVATIKGMKAKPGSMGRPSPGYDVDIVDDAGNSVDSGVVGEIVVLTDKKTTGVFVGYLKDEEKTKSVWYDDVYHTGDLAWRDEDGYYWYVGRKDDIIKSSGYRIGPFEVENVLMEHPAIVECAVTGAPDPIRGQVIKATIVLAAGYEASEELKKEIQNYVKKNTAPYKYPRIVDFVTELPKTISGKIRRVEIRGEDK